MTESVQYMKRIVILLLSMIICLLLCACGQNEPRKSQSVKDVERAIESIGNITLDSGEAISKAESMYEILTDNEKAQVDNKATLAEARFNYDNLLSEQKDVWNEQREIDRLDAIKKFRDYCVKNGVQLTEVSVYQIDVEGQGVDMSVLVQGQEKPRTAFSISYTMTDELVADKTTKCITNFVLEGDHRQAEGQYYLYHSHTITQKGKTSKLTAGTNFEPQTFVNDSALVIENVEKEGADIITQRDIDAFRKTASLDLHLIMDYFDNILTTSGLGLSIDDFGFLQYIA